MNDRDKQGKKKQQKTHDSNNSSYNWAHKIINKLHSLLLTKPKTLQQILEIIKDSISNKIITEESYKMIEGVLEVSKMQARDIMIPRSQMIVIEKDADTNDFLPKMIESGHSRFPVIGENRDEIIGILLAKDVLPYILKAEVINVKELLRPAMIIPESKRLNILLKEFRIKRQHMAIIADEYGGISGLVTIEDILEQIVGDIEDEFDIEEENNIIELKNNSYQVQALTSIEEFNEYFKSHFSDDEFDTIGGVVLNKFGYLPTKNESVSINGFKIKVLNADKRRIRLLKITINKNSHDNSDNNNINNNMNNKSNDDNDNKNSELKKNES